MMYIANNELVKTDKRIKVSKTASKGTNGVAVMQRIVCINGKHGRETHGTKITK